MIISFLGYVFKTTLFAFYTVSVILLNDYLKRTYPEQYESYIIYMSLKSIYVFSKCQIVFNKQMNHFKTICMSNEHINNLVTRFYKIDNIDDLEFVLDGKVIYTTSKNKILDGNVSNVPKKYDIVIYSDYNSVSLENQCVNKKILSSFPVNKDSYNYEVSNIQFFLIEIKLAEKTIKLNLKTDKVNYYTVNNKLDFSFFKYFLKKYHNEDLMSFSDIQLHILDHNVSNVNIDIQPNFKLTIEKEKYIIEEISSINTSS